MPCHPPLLNPSPSIPSNLINTHSLSLSLVCRTVFWRRAAHFLARGSETGHMGRPTPKCRVLPATRTYDIIDSVWMRFFNWELCWDVTSFQRVNQDRSCRGSNCYDVTTRRKMIPAWWRTICSVRNWTFALARPANKMLLQLQLNLNWFFIWARSSLRLFSQVKRLWPLTL